MHAFFCKSTYTKFFSEKISFTAYIVVVIIVILYNAFEQDWKNPDRVIQTDVKGYYLYLPSFFIHHDVTLNYINENPAQYSGKVWFLKTPEGNKIIQYTYGQALLYSPFFLIAHGIAPLLGYESYGYSPPYKFALLVSSIFYLALALFFLRKLLKKYFSDPATAIALFVVVIGTNLLYYSSKEATMTHSYNFSFIVFFIYNMVKWLEKPAILRTVLLGFITGMIVLIRPTNVLVIVLFLLWGFSSWNGFLDRIVFLLKSYWKIALMIFVFFLVWVPQFLYWKEITGSYFYFSYQERAMFFFNDPEVINVLFSYRKGWLLYTPIMIFSLIGTPFLYKQNQELFWPVLIFTLLNIYLLSSWCFWWYGGGFGLRAFVDSYGILAFPIAAFVQWFLKEKVYLRIMFLALFAVLVWFNLFQTKQYKHNAIHFVSMTKGAYWESFLKTRPTQEFYDKLEYPDYKSVEDRIKRVKEERRVRKEKN